MFFEAESYEEENNEPAFTVYVLYRFYIIYIYTYITTLILHIFKAIGRGTIFFSLIILFHLYLVSKMSPLQIMNGSHFMMYNV